MYPKLKINVYFIFLNIGDLTFGITLVCVCCWDWGNKEYPGAGAVSGQEVGFRFC
jgi:hypothetical protein